MKRPSLLVATAAYPSPSEPYRARAVHLALLTLLDACDVTVLTPRNRRGDPKREIADGVTVRRYDWPLAVARPKHGGLVRGFSYVKSAFLAVLSEVPRHDAVYAHWVVPFGVAAAFWGALFRKPLLLHVLGTDFNSYASGAAGRLWRRTLRRAKAVFAVGPYLTGAVRRRFGVPVIDPGVAVDTASLDRWSRGEARQALGLPADCFYAVFVSDVSRAKGAHVAFEACRRLVFRHERFYAAFVGAGRLSTLLSREAHSRLRVLGPRPPEEAAVHIRAADVLLLPTAAEGLPSAVLEALHAGCLPLLSPIPALKESLRPGDALFVEPTPEAYVRVLRRLLEGPFPRPSPGRAAPYLGPAPLWRETVLSCLSGS